MSLAACSKAAWFKAPVEMVYHQVSANQTVRAKTLKVRNAQREPRPAYRPPNWYRARNGGGFAAVR